MLVASLFAITVASVSLVSISLINNGTSNPPISNPLAFVRWRGNSAQLLATGYDQGRSRQILLANLHGAYATTAFIEFLQALDQKYLLGVKNQIILDNHSAHTSREPRAYLATVSNRFDFVFTPIHASWLNLIEVSSPNSQSNC